MREWIGLGGKQSDGRWLGLIWFILVGFSSVLVYPCLVLSPLGSSLVLVYPSFVGFIPVGFIPFFGSSLGFNPVGFMPVWVHPLGFISISTRQPHLDVLEHVGVVADLAQLHDRVHQRLRAAFPLPGTIHEVKNPD